MEGLAEWQSRPLDAVYAVIFIDAINVKIREGQVANRPVYLALGVTVDGERDVLRLWAGEHGDGEGAKYWLRVLSEIKNRGVRDVCMLVCDGLKGLPDAVSAALPSGSRKVSYLRQRMPVGLWVVRLGGCGLGPRCGCGRGPFGMAVWWAVAAHSPPSGSW